MGNWEDGGNDMSTPAGGAGRSGSTSSIMQRRPSRKAGLQSIWYEEAGASVLMCSTSGAGCASLLG